MNYSNQKLIYQKIFELNNMQAVSVIDEITLGGSEHILFSTHNGGQTIVLPQGNSTLELELFEKDVDNYPEALFGKYYALILLNNGYQIALPTLTKVFPQGFGFHATALIAEGDYYTSGLRIHIMDSGISKYRLHIDFPENQGLNGKNFDPYKVSCELTLSRGSSGGPQVFHKKDNILLSDLDMSQLKNFLKDANVI